MQRDDILNEIADIAKRLCAIGAVGTYEGNISVCDRKAGRIYITPSATSKEFLIPREIVETDMQGKVISSLPNKKPSSEIIMHTQLYTLRPEVNAVVHSHAPHCVAFAMNHMPIASEAMAEINLIFGGEIPLLPYGEPGTDKLLNGLDNYPSQYTFLLANHGLIALGKDLKEAYGRAVSAENMAKTLYISKMLGEAVPLPRDILFKLQNKLK